MDGDIQSLTEQGRIIKDLIYKIQDLLASYSIVEFFKAHPEQTQQILAGTEEIQSRRLVLYGLAERLQSAVLPLRETLADRTNDWLEPGDVVVGWQGALIDAPRVIKELTEDGYIWRYYQEPDETERDPIKLDPFFQHVGWENLGSDLSIEEIYGIQEEEIVALSGKLEYFSSREFLND